MAADRPGRGDGKAPSLPLADRAHLAAPAADSPHQNHLLDALPASDFERIASHLELIPLQLGEVPYESGSRLRYVYFPTTSIISLLYTQMAPTAVCNRRHSVDQQLRRWLLLSLNRSGSSDLSMTQELIANMLGVRREGLTEAARKLQSARLIRYGRGRITVLDRPGLEARCCECYQGGQDGI